MKKAIVLLCVALMVLGMIACTPEQNNSDPTNATNKSEETNDKFVIGICQYMPHPALDKATEGFIAAVEEGLGKDNVVIYLLDTVGNTMIAPIIPLIIPNLWPM